MNKLELVVSTLKKIQLDVPVIRKGDMIEKGSLHWDRLANHVMPVLREAEKQITKGAPPGTRAATSGKTEVVCSINLVQSVIDGMEDKELSHADLKEAMAKLQDYLRNGSSKIEQVLATTVAAKVDQQEHEENAVEQAEGEAKLFAKMARFADGLPTNGAKDKDPFVLKRLPVIPTFKKAITAGQLHKIGFKVLTNEGYYTVLGDQLCVGINIAKEKPKSPLDYAKHVAQVVSNKLGEQYSVMGEDLKLGAGRPLTRTKGYLWFWLTPHAVLTRMDRFGGSALQDWGFAFK